jgi:phosphodiesterase/alkaline phosphatase D-like protein
MMSPLARPIQMIRAFDINLYVPNVVQTKKVPHNAADVAQMQYCCFSCSNFGNCGIHVYDVASTIPDLETFCVHVGGYVYEYGSFSTQAAKILLHGTKIA